jgi:hypothetical protein
MASIISAGTTSGTALNMSADTTGILQLATGATPTTAVTVDASQNVGIGVTPSSDKLAVSSTGNAAYFVNATTNATSNKVKIHLAPTSDFGANWSTYEPPYIAGINATAGFADSGIVFNTYDSGTNAERMRIASNGQITVTANAGTGIGPLIKSVTGSTNGWRIGNYSAIVGGGSNDSMTCANSGGGGVFISGASGTSWSAVSDERLKENLEEITDAANKVSQLRTVIGNYTWDAEKVKRSFLIAQDVQKVLPEAVSVQDDEIGTLGVSYTDVIPLLVAAIKEQQTIINDLKARVETLESK